MGSWLGIHLVVLGLVVARSLKVPLIVFLGAFYTNSGWYCSAA